MKKLPRKKGSTNKSTQNNDIELTEKEKDYVMQFAKELNGFMMNPYVFNPFLQNQIIKDLNMNPFYQDRDKVEEMVSNPRANELGLRRLAQYLENTIMPLKRIMDYYSKILTWDYIIIPTLADEKDLRGSAFKKAENRIYDFLDAFNPKKAMTDVMKGCVLEDGKFYYLRQSAEGVALQELPSDYCMITHKTELGYKFAFNMSYFLRAGVDFDNFAPEFREWYAEVVGYDKNRKYDDLKVEMKDGKYFYWKTLPEDKAWVFKFDPVHAGLTPPLLGLFIDSVEVDTYRKLQKAKTALEAYKLIIGTVPRHKDNKTGNAKDDFALQAATVAKFAAMLKGSMPEGVDFKVTPFESIQAFDFPNSQNKNDISGRALKNLLNNSGSSQVMSINEKPNASAIKAGQTIDASFVEHLYLQAEIFVNYQLKLIAPKYGFKIKFEGTIFDKEERTKQAKEWAAMGIITDKIGASMGLTPREFDKAINYFVSRGYPDKLKPLQSSFNSNTAKENGRPNKDVEDLSDGGVRSLDNDFNDI